MKTVSSLAEVEQCLAERAWRGNFPPEIEAAYLQNRRNLRARAFRRLILPMLVTYNLFLVADFLIMPDTWLLALFLHLFIVSPAMLLVWRYYADIKSNFWSGVAEGLVPSLMFAQIMLIYALNPQAADAHYQYFAIAVIMFANVNMRPRHDVARKMTILLVASFFTITALVPSSMETKLASLSMMLATVYVSLMANLSFTWDSRLNFLRSLQDQFRFKNAEAEAMSDPLTGVKNRRFLEEFASRDLHLLSERYRQVGVVMADVDNFKIFNDTCGHQAGDICLASVSRAITASVRGETDLVVRYGGEEFLVIMPGADAAETMKAAERIRRAVLMMQLPHEKNIPHKFVTVSLGGASGSSNPEHLWALIAEADAALYTAKTEGRNRASFHPNKPIPGEA